MAARGNRRRDARLALVVRHVDVHVEAIALPVFDAVSLVKLLRSDALGHISP